MRACCVALLVAALAALGCGTSGPAADPVTGGERPHGTACPFELTVGVEGKPSRDHLSLKLSVKNRSQDAMGWDKEFVSFLVWNVKPSGSDKPLKPTTLNQSQTKKVTLPKDRFVRVPAGGEMATVMDLTQGYRAFGYFPVVGLGDPRSLSAFEERARFEIPGQAKMVVVQVEYQGLSPAAFEKLYGVSSEECGMWYGFTKSNELRIDLKDNDAAGKSEKGSGASNKD